MHDSVTHNIDRIEQMIDKCGNDLSPVELAICFHQAFLTGQLQEVLGSAQVEEMYYAMMAGFTVESGSTEAIAL